MADGKVPKRLRRGVMHRDRLTCQSCGLTGREKRFPRGVHGCPTDRIRKTSKRAVASEMRVNLSIDHIVPVARGGTNHRSNLRILCEDCNTHKGTKAA